ncbi:MAG: hypothetical protein IJI57_11090 [Flexilinea sp.]|nr:hypothetical protein [Flexilinea sp.]
MTEINRTNKDRLFRFIFGREENKGWTLELYNAINGTSYTDPNDITITTIDDVLYMDMKNDISILVSNFLNFFEQQSTFNPNLPIRFLVYAGMIYSGLFESKKKPINIYSSKIQKLPIPKCVCFYNGTQDQPDESYLYLSSAFPEGSDPDINVKVRMLNINYGHNRELLNACRPLHDYAFLINQIRFHQSNGLSIEAAVDHAIRDLSNDSVIKPFILKNKAEVKRMCITEYDEVRTMNLFKEEGREEGIFDTLVNLVRDKLLDITEAAKRANMTIDEFKSAAKL